MEYKFIEEIIDKKNLTKSETGINNFLLENNVNQIEKILFFLQSKNPLMLVNGFMGTGKNHVVSHSLSFKSKETLVLEYNCFETTILDDILLGFFDDFKKLIAQGIVKPPKTKSENFTQMINAHFQSVEKPVIVVLNSFEVILKDNKQEILDFIFHLSTFANVKVILISRRFAMDDFENKINYDKVSILALEKSIFEKYLRSENIKLIGPLSDELYKQTRGYYFYTTLSIKVMNMRKLSLPDFLSGHTKSLLSYNDFILREILALVDPVSGHLFRFLTIMRHPVSIKLLKMLQLYNEERVNFFLDNLVLAKDGNSIYLEDYYKEISENSIPDNIKIKLHRGCVELYETQLPLKPLERDLLISRQTMRKEIEYHSLFIPKRPVLVQQPVSGAQMMELQQQPVEQKVEVTKQEKDNQLKNMSFFFESEESSSMLDAIANSINNYIDVTDKEMKEQQEINSMQLRDLINLAKQEEINYNHNKVISIYEKALTLDDDDDYYAFLPTILTKLAQTYKNASDWFNAQKYYKSAKDFFASTGDEEKINEINLEIANIYLTTFKKDEAEELLEQIIESETISNGLKVKTYLSLANLGKNPIFYYQKAIGLIDTSTEKTVLSELYFKYGLALDENNDPEQAVIFYKKCIELDSNPKNNPYLSSSLSNIATIFDEIGKPELAAKYSIESLRIDEQTNNYNGIYISAMKLAEIYTRRNPEKALEYFKKAKACAKELNEPFYIASTEIAMGDFFYNRKENKNAVDSYKRALKTAQNHFNKENIQKIESRLNDIKLRIGETEYNRLANG